jgi:hypothetical protein
MIDEDLINIKAMLPFAHELLTGSMDPLFNVIFDGEAVLQGKQTLARGTRQEVAGLVRRELQKFIAARSGPTAG